MIDVHGAITIRAIPDVGQVVVSALHDFSDVNPTIIVSCALHKWSSLPETAAEHVSLSLVCSRRKSRRV